MSYHKSLVKVTQSVNLIQLVESHAPPARAALVRFSHFTKILLSHIHYD